MGKKARRRPQRLGEKLHQIRDALGLSQAGILKRIGLDGKHKRNNLSNYEHNRREAPMDLVLGYARLARVRVDMLLDDKLELPERFPSTPVNSRQSKGTTPGSAKK